MKTPEKNQKIYIIRKEIVTIKVANGNFRIKKKNFSKEVQ
jgi:hypothetical protein